MSFSLYVSKSKNGQKQISLVLRTTLHRNVLVKMPTFGALILPKSREGSRKIQLGIIRQIRTVPVVYLQFVVHYSAI